MMDACSSHLVHLRRNAPKGEATTFQNQDDITFERKHLKKVDLLWCITIIQPATQRVLSLVHESGGFPSVPPSRRPLALDASCTSHLAAAPLFQSLGQSSPSHLDCKKRDNQEHFRDEQESLRCCTLEGAVGSSKSSSGSSEKSLVAKREAYVILCEFEPPKQTRYKGECQNTNPAHSIAYYGHWPKDKGLPPC